MMHLIVYLYFYVAFELMLALSIFMFLVSACFLISERKTLNSSEMLSVPFVFMAIGAIIGICWLVSIPYCFAWIKKETKQDDVKCISRALDKVYR